MKFDEVYKQANDSIHADKNIIDTLFETKDEKKFLNFRTLSLCAAALVVVFSLSMLPEFYKGNNSSDNKIVYNGDNSSKADTSQKTQKKTEESPLKKESTEKSTLPSAQYNAAVEESAADIQTDDIIQGDINQENDESTPVAPIEDFMDKTTSYARTAKINEPSESNVAFFEMSYREYINYLGWDIVESGLNLPEGMEISVPDTVVISRDKKNDEIVDDTINYSFTNADNPYSYMSLSLSRVGSNIDSEGYKSYRLINQTEIFLKENDSFREVYAKHNDVWLYITSIDVSMEEIDAFLNSLIY